MSVFPALYTPADVTTGHGCFPPTGYLPPPVGASSDVFIHLAPVHRVGDVTIPHLCSGPDIHPDVIATGFPTVLVNTKPIALFGASILAPGGIVAGLSAINVYVGSGTASGVASRVDTVVKSTTDAVINNVPPVTIA